jgi:signal peptidase I
MMDIDLPLVLVCLSFAGIIIWLFDLIVLKPKRIQRVLLLQQNYKQWQQVGSEDERQYLQQLPKAQEEHVIVRETKSLLPIILIVLIVRSFIVEPFQIPSSSMEPTLDVGDFILVNKYTYGLRLPVLGTKVIDNTLPQRGDVMVFFPPQDSRYFIKRVIGLPGDVIEYRNKVLTINGNEQSLVEVKDAPMDYEERDLFQEDLNGLKHVIFRQPRRPAEDFRVTVEPNHYFMMGDNRDNSSDSRFWGQVPEERIVGKAVAIWMHWKDWASIPSFSRVGKIE